MSFSRLSKREAFKNISQFHNSQTNAAMEDISLELYWKFSIYLPDIEFRNWGLRESLIIDLTISLIHTIRKRWAPVSDFNSQHTAIPSTYEEFYFYKIQSKTRIFVSELFRANASRKNEAFIFIIFQRSEMIAKLNLIQCDLLGQYVYSNEVIAICEEPFSAVCL